MSMLYIPPEKGLSGYSYFVTAIITGPKICACQWKGSPSSEGPAEQLVGGSFFKSCSSYTHIQLFITLFSLLLTSILES